MEITEKLWSEISSFKGKNILNVKLPYCRGTISVVPPEETN